MWDRVSVSPLTTEESLVLISPVCSIAGIATLAEAPADKNYEFDGSLTTLKCKVVFNIHRTPIRIVIFATSNS